MRSSKVMKVRFDINSYRHMVHAPALARVRAHADTLKVWFSATVNTFSDLNLAKQTQINDGA